MTEGPWKLRFGARCSLIHGKWWAVKELRAQDRTIALVCAEDDARAIALVPEMVELLRRVPNVFRSVYQLELASAVNELLAKLEGKDD